MGKLKTAKKRIFAVALCAALSITMAMPSFASQISGSGESISSDNEDSQNRTAPTETMTLEEFNSLKESGLIFEDENGDPVELTEEDVKAMESISSEDQGIVLSENDPIVQISDDDIKDEKTDALTETYIKQNVNPEYAEYKDIRLVDALYGKQTLFDMSKMEDNDTPESIMHAIEYGNEENSSIAMDKFLTQMSSPIAVYDIDEESDYYIALVNTLFNEKGVTWLDCVFTEYNELGHEIEGCTYDDETGLAYLPKSLFNVEDEGIMAYQVQVCHGISEYEGATADVDALSNSNKETEINTTVSDLIDASTNVKVTEGMDPEDLSVSVNGIPIPEELYEYDEDAGELLVNVSPGACQTISVTDGTNPIARMAKSVFGPIAVKAVTLNSMDFYKRASVKIPSNVTNGAYFAGTAWVKYKSSGQIHTGTEIDANSGIYGYGRSESGMKELINAISYGYSINESKLKTHTYQTGMFDFYLDLADNTLVQQNGSGVSGSFMNNWGEFILECAHTKTPVLDKQSSISTSWKKVKIGLRFFKIERSGSQPYAIVGIMTSKSNGQMGNGLFKLHIEANPDPIPATVSASNTQNFSETVTITVTKKDSQTNAVLAGAKYQLYEDSKSTARGSVITTNANGVATLTYTRYSGNITKSSGNYTYVTNWNEISTDQRNACSSKGWYSSKSAALAAANQNVASQLNTAKATFLNKAHTWYAKEIAAPSNHRLNSAILSASEAANRSSASFSFTNDEPTGSIKVLKTDINGTNNILSKDKRVTYEGATYGVYAAQKILKSDNKTQLYAKDALVATVKITKHKDGYYGMVSNLPPGSYYAKELSNPFGFQLNTGKTPTVTLDADETSTTATMTTQVTQGKESETSTGLNITKYARPLDGSVKTLEEGAKFAIIDKTNGGEEMVYSTTSGAMTRDKNKAISTEYTLITNANGKASLKGIPIGVYEIRQVGEEDRYLFTSPQTFEVNENASELSPIEYTFNNDEKPEIPRIKVLKSARIEDAGTDTHLALQEDGVIFDVYKNYDEETKTGDLVDVLITGATSLRGYDKEKEAIASGNKSSFKVSVLEGEDIDRAHEDAEKYAAYLRGETNTEPADTVYIKANNGDGNSRGLEENTTYTLVQRNKTNGYRIIKPFTIDIQENARGYYGDKDDDNENLYRYNDFDGEKIVIDKRRTDVKGVEYKEANASFTALDIGKIKELEQSAGYDSFTYGTFPYEDYLLEGAERDQEAIYRQQLSGYLEAHDCVIGKMETDSDGHAEMIVMPESYLYQYDDTKSWDEKGIALLQTSGHASVAMQPVLTSKDAYESDSGETLNYEYAARARDNKGVTNLQYSLTDKPNKVGYIVLHKYFTTTVNDSGEKMTQPEGNAVFQILNAETGVLVQTMPATKNSNGYTKSSALPFGKYILHQVSGVEGHALCEDRIIEINKNTIDDNKVFCGESNSATPTFTRYNFSFIEFFDTPYGYEITPDDNGKADLGISFTLLPDGTISKSANDYVKVVNKINVSSEYDEGYEVVLRREVEKHKSQSVSIVRLLHKKDADSSSESWIIELYDGNTLIGTSSVYAENGDTNISQYSNDLKETNNENPVKLRLTKKTKGEYDSQGREITNHLLNDATFKILDKRTGKTIGMMTTGKNADGEYEASWEGKAEEDVKYGNYILREIEAPAGYKEMETEVKVNAYTVKYEGDTAYLEVEVEDEPIFGELKGNKTGDSLAGTNSDEEGTGFVYDQKVLPGATYDLFAKEDITSPDGSIVYHKAGDLISTATSDEVGEIIFKRTLPDGTTTKNLYLGDYYVVEKVAPLGYTLDTEPHDVSVRLSSAAEAANNAVEKPVSEYEITDDNKYAYAVLGDDGTLTFFRSAYDYTNYVDEFAEEDSDPVNCDKKHSNDLGFDFVDVNGITHSGKLYTGIEDLTNGSTPPWYGDAGNILNVEVAYEQVIRPNAMTNWFENCSNMKTCDLVRFDTQNITDLTDLFNGCSSMTSLTQNFDTSNVTTATNAFKGCNKLTFLDLTHWDTKNMTTASNMFNGGSGYDYIYISDKWNASNVSSRNSVNMFHSCTGLENFDASTTDSTNAIPTDMGGYLTLLDKVGQIDVGKATVTYDSNNGAFDTGRTTNIVLYKANEDGVMKVKVGEYKEPTREGYRFDGWYLERSTINPFDFDSLENAVTVYAKWAIQPATLMDGKTLNATLKTIAAGRNTSYTAGNATIKSFTRTTTAPADLTSKTKISAADSLHPVYAWFDSATGVMYWYSATDTIYLNADASYMFSNMTALTNPSLSGIDTTKVTDTSYMFNDDKSLSAFNINAINTSKVTNMEGMFAGCQNLTSLTLTGTNTSRVTNMKQMFLDCRKLANIDLSGFNTGNVTDMTDMFMGCETLGSIVVSDIFDLSNVIDSEDMFNGCTSLPNFDENITDKTNAHTGEGGYLTAA